MKIVSIFLLCVLQYSIVHLNGQADSQIVQIPIHEAEYWWGGASNDGFLMPYEIDFNYDMYANNKGNQVQPLFISSKGRMIWSEEAIDFEIKENKITAKVEEGIITSFQSGNSLKEAFQFASKNYFPASGKMPHPILFRQPQYNTWIELMYNQNQNDILEYAKAIIDNGFPPGVLMIDDNWQEDYGKWDFHPTRFPDPKNMMDSLHSMGFKVMLWICPLISPDSDIYRNLAKRGALMKVPADEKTLGAPWLSNGQPALIHWWNGASAVLDFSNPEAVLWFKSKLNDLTEKYQVDGFKFDAGDYYFYPDHLVSFGKEITPNEHSELFGRIGLEYSLNEYRAMWKMGGQALVQRLSDKSHSWGDLQKLIPNIIAQGLMGYAFTCPDMIGGGEFTSFLNNDEIDEELIVRSAQTHALMPMMQFSVAPWRILDKSHLKVVKKAIEIRAQFVPIIMELAKEAAKTGEPIVRAMEYEFPNQGFAKVKDQFMLGDKILVAPNLEKGKVERMVKLPKGKWRDQDGNILIGSRQILVAAPLEILPIFQKIE